MKSKDGSDNIFDEVADGGGFGKEPETQEKEDYNAFGHESKGVNSIIITMRDDDDKHTIKRQPFYSSLLDVVSTSDEYMALYFTNYIIIVQGKKLRNVHEMIQKSELSAINLFMNHHKEPADTEPKVTSIERRSLQEKKKD